MEKSEVVRLADLLIKYRKGFLSPEELVEVESWMEENENLYRALNSDDIVEEIWQDRLSKDRVFGILERRMEMVGQGAARGRMLIMRRGVWAAVILSIVAAVFLVVINSGSTSRSGNLASNGGRIRDIGPGTRKAILTLSGGDTVILADRKDGVIAREGNAGVEKTASGKIVYSKSSDRGLAGKVDVVYNILTVPRGAEYFVQLSDGTKVWLNSASSLRYPAVFGGDERRVELRGEAYFEVAKVRNSDDGFQPFVVDVPPPVAGGRSCQIRVRGTHFDVNAYPEELDIRTTLLEGAVKVISQSQGSNDDEAAVLVPGEQARVSSSYDRGRKVLTIMHEDVEDAASWKDGVISFQNENIQGIMRNISRWYDVDVVYRGVIPERAFMGGISRNSNLSDVLKVLELNKIHFEMDGRKIMVTP